MYTAFTFDTLHAADIADIADIVNIVYMVCIVYIVPIVYVVYYVHSVYMTQRNPGLHFWNLFWWAPFLNAVFMHFQNVEKQ